MREYLSFIEQLVDNVREDKNLLPCSEDRQPDLLISCILSAYDAFQSSSDVLVRLVSASEMMGQGQRCLSRVNDVHNWENELGEDFTAKYVEDIEKHCSFK